ncbi:MAG TPA: fimbria/pilus periplasmic chaperone [bacterium]|nr:fimbria/pilus periplasmic chaperone [bacterium]
MASYARFLLAVLLLVPVPLQALAGSFKVVPVRLFLEPGEKTAVLRITNEGKTPITIQVSAKTWHQDAQGEDRYEDTKDIIFFPRIFTMQPEGAQVLRIGLRTPPVKDRELTYRIFLEELPVTAPGQMVLKFALRMGVPIFIEPPEQTKKWELRGIAIDKGHGRIEVTNSGNRHIVVTGIDLKGMGANGTQLYEAKGNGWYVLSGHTRAFGVRLPKDKCVDTRRLAMVVKVGNDSKDFMGDVSPTTALCTPPKPPAKPGPPQNVQSQAIPEK